MLVANILENTSISYTPSKATLLKFALNIPTVNIITLQSSMPFAISKVYRKNSRKNLPVPCTFSDH